jgi:uncharacterized coiled-coil protein SlyX
MDNDELAANLHNSVESLTTRIEKLEESNAEIVVALEKLNKTVTETNQVFDEVSEGVKNLYEKVKSLEIWSKLLGNINLSQLLPLLSGLGGLGNLGKQNPPKSS